MRDRPWRKIVRRDTRWEETSSCSIRRYSWRATEVHTLTLECGHTQTRRGYYAPKHQVVCKECEAGVAAQPVEVEPGVFADDPQVLPRDPIARAILENAHEHGQLPDDAEYLRREMERGDAC